MAYRMKMLGRAVVCVLAVSHIGIALCQERHSPDAAVQSNTLPGTDVCGKHGPTRLKRVTGGSDAALGMYPWMVALGYSSSGDSKTNWLCAGSLVTDRHVVTAATCVSSRGIVPKIAKLGVIDLTDSVQDDGSPSEYEVDTWTAHPGYNASEMVNNIAIIRLKNKVTFSRFIQPICLPTPDEFKTKNFTGLAAHLAGWGTTDYSSSQAARLQHVQIRVWGQSECKKAYKAMKAVIDNKVVCAGDGGKDSCQGDSGAPLMMPYGPDSNYYLFAIVSYGVQCADPSYPGVYTRVSEYADWILQNIK